MPASPGSQVTTQLSEAIVRVREMILRGELVPGQRVAEAPVAEQLGMVAGIEAEIFRPDDELRRLARCAVEFGVDGHFRDGVAVKETLAALRSAGEPGDAWLAELETSRNPWFNINVGDGFYHYHRSWNDDLTLPLSCRSATSASSVTIRSSRS